MDLDGLGRNLWHKPVEIIYSKLSSDLIFLKFFEMSEHDILGILASYIHKNGDDIDFISSAILHKWNWQKKM